MNTCFVMQPFDGDVYDKRYEDVFAPAIQDAGLEPYRVDRDASVSVPIDEIEAGIRRAQFCFAEITTDNPNVWFELGYAIAAARDVVLVCSEERKSHFPFDVQHRSIIRYRTGAPRDFAELRQNITKRITSLIKKQEEIGHVSSMSPLKETEGLSQHEIVALVTLLENAFIFGEFVAARRIKEDMNSAGFTNIAVTVAMKLLCRKNMALSRSLQDEQGEEYAAFAATRQGEEWLLANQDKLVLRQEPPSPF